MKFSHIATLVRENRIKQGYSQEELSKKMGYKNGQFVSNCERGICSIPLKKLKLAADLLAMPFEEIKEAVLKDYEQRIDGRMV